MHPSTRVDSANLPRRKSTPLHSPLPQHIPRYYDILGVPSTASKAEIGKAFRLKALTLHPDRETEGQANSTEEFTRVVEAYEILSDDEQKKKYDAKLNASLFPQQLDESSHVPSYLLREDNLMSFHSDGLQRPASSSSHLDDPYGQSRQRWDSLFTERNGKLERRPTSKAHQRDLPSRQSGISSPVAENIGSSNLPPRGPTPLAGQSRTSSRAGPRNRVHKEETPDEFPLRTSERESITSKPPTPSSSMRNRQLRLHKDLMAAHNTPLRSGSASDSKGIKKSEQDITGVAPVGSKNPFASGKSTPVDFAQLPVPQHRPVRHEPSSLDLLPDGVPVFPKTSYSPHSKLPFMKLDAHISPTRKAASHSLSQRYLRTTGTSTLRSRAPSPLRASTNTSIVPPSSSACAMRFQNLFFPEFNRINR